MNGLTQIFFALYAATDSLMTYKLYEWQLTLLQSDPEMSNLLKLALELESPLTEVTADMELRGITLDAEYSARLSEKYKKLLEDVNKKLEDELAKYKDKIAEWRLTPEANNTTVKSSVKDILELTGPKKGSK